MSSPHFPVHISIFTFHHFMYVPYAQCTLCVLVCPHHTVHLKSKCNKFFILFTHIGLQVCRYIYQCILFTHIGLQSVHLQSSDKLRCATNLAALTLVPTGYEPRALRPPESQDHSQQLWIFFLGGYTLGGPLLLPLGASLSFTGALLHFLCIFQPKTSAGSHQRSPHFSTTNHPILPVLGGLSRPYLGAPKLPPSTTPIPLHHL